MHHTPSVKRIVILAFLVFIAAENLAQQSTSGARCTVNIVHTVDIPEDHIVLHVDLPEVVTSHACITLTIYSSLNKELDFTVTVPPDTCLFFDHPGSIIYTADTLFTLSDSSALSPGNQLIRITGEMVILDSLKGQKSVVKAPVGIRIDYY